MFNTVNDAMGFTAGAYNHFLRKKSSSSPSFEKEPILGEPPSQNFTACGARRAVARIFDWRWSTCERNEHHSSVARSVTELWLWSASEVCASVPIELAGVWGRSPRKIFGKFYFLECIFYKEFTFIKMIEPHARLSWVLVRKVSTIWYTYTITLYLLYSSFE